jgi:16S rRNA G966 N2-methylase RsmD
MGARHIQSESFGSVCRQRSVGIEALSRGAAQTVFVDNDKNAIKTIGENLKNCGFEDGYELYHNDVFRALEILSRNRRYFDYIYVDPPLPTITFLTKS